MFPHGWPGLALLLLRIAVASILFETASRLGGPPSAILSAGIVLASVLAFALIVGFLTPLLSLLTCLAALGRLLCGPSVEPMSVFIAVLVAGALALLGPGAYSVDARLYGRRVTVVQARKETDPPAKRTTDRR